VNLLAVLIFPLAATAQAADPDDHLFQAPAAFSATKFSSDCGGGDSPDLQPDLPPIDDQKMAPWCVSFDVKAMLEYQYHRDHPADNYATRFSVVDINTRDFSRPNDFGRTPNFTGGATPLDLLDGVQKTGALFREADRPFDPNVFSSGALVAELSRYYQAELPFDQKAALQCRDTNPEFQQLEREFGSLLELLHQASGLEDFVDRAMQTKPPLADPKPGATPVTLEPPPAYRQFMAKNGDQYAQELKQRLAEKEPVAVPVCGTQLQELPGLGGGGPVPPAERNLCGPHRLLVVGMKTVNGKCMVKLRNSWGKEWPAGDLRTSTAAAGKEGYGMISLDDLLRISLPSGDGLDMVSLKPAGGGAGANTLESGAGYSFTGKTQQGNFVDGHFSGKFDGNHFYEGDMKNGRPDGQGHSIAADGTDQNGTFEQGRFISGTFKGRLNPIATYVGDVVNSAPDGQGRLVMDDGTVVAGAFKAGVIQEGTYDGPWNGNKDRIYHGPMHNGHTAPEGQWTDGKGNLLPGP
jgi:hypothetical protein